MYSSGWSHQGRCHKEGGTLRIYTSKDWETHSNTREKIKSAHRDVEQTIAQTVEALRAAEKSSVVFHRYQRGTQMSSVRGVTKSQHSFGKIRQLCEGWIRRGTRQRDQLGFTAIAR